MRYPYITSCMVQIWKMNVYVILSLSLLLGTEGSPLPPHTDPPKPPSLADTFKSSGTVRIDLGDKNITGQFTIARWHNGTRGLESETYSSNTGSTTSRALLRYDRNMTYYIRGDADEPHCYAEDRVFNNMSRFWEWLDGAQYINSSTVEKTVYDLWGRTIGGVQFEFGMPRDLKNKPTVLYYFNRKSEVSVFYSFLKYQRLTADDIKKDATFPKLFDVPNFCR